MAALTVGDQDTGSGFQRNHVSSVDASLFDVLVAVGRPSSEEDGGSVEDIAGPVAGAVRHVGRVKTMQVRE